MSNKSRGGLSKRELAAKQSVLKPSKSPVMDTSSAKKAASLSVSKESKSLAKANKEYLKSLKPSSDETAAIKAQQDLLLGQEQEVKKITNTQGDRGNNVAAPFIERQVEKVSSDTEAKVIPLKYQIAALQSAREARGNIASTKARFATEGYNRKVSEIKASEKVSTGKKEKTPAQLLAAENAAYELQKKDNTQRGFVTLPKGVSGPPAPKVLMDAQKEAQKKTKKGRVLPGVNG